MCCELYRLLFIQGPFSCVSVFCLIAIPFFKVLEITAMRGLHFLLYRSQGEPTAKLALVHTQLLFNFAASVRNTQFEVHHGDYTPPMNWCSILSYIAHAKTSPWPIAIYWIWGMVLSRRHIRKPRHSFVHPLYILSGRWPTHCDSKGCQEPVELDNGKTIADSSY
jgi:hypothetical protein